MNNINGIKKRVLKYLLPVFIFSILFNIPKFFEAQIEYVPSERGHHNNNVSTCFKLVNKFFLWWFLSSYWIWICWNLIESRKWRIYILENGWMSPVSPVFHTVETVRIVLKYMSPVSPVFHTEVKVSDKNTLVDS